MARSGDEREASTPKNVWLSQSPEVPGWVGSSIAHEGQYLEPRALKANITASGVINSTPDGAKYDYSITLSNSPNARRIVARAINRFLQVALLDLAPHVVHI